MGSLYYPQAADVLRAAGVEVAESSINAGWERRARSSGGFSAAPLGIVWHHTASDTNPQNDLSWMIDGCDDAPVGNLLLDRDGVVWMIAGGAANTQGKGGPCSFSRGVAPLDSGNSTLWAMEVANGGTGQRWPEAQVTAYFKASNALNEMFGNLPTDVITHAINNGDGWTDRKIDPATSDAVEGPWVPHSVSSSGTWSLDDIRAECARRATTTQPEPEPPRPVPGDDDTMIAIFENQSHPKQFNAMFFGVCDAQGRSIELQWSGPGDDPAVQERIATMQANFPTFNLELGGTKNNRLAPPHRPSDINDSLHTWVDSDFAP